MHNLYILCPTTKKPADTGFTMDAETFAKAKLVDKAKAFECGHCHDFHAWTKEDVLPFS